MIRRPLRSTPLRCGTTRLRRYVKLRPFNPARRARLYERNFGAYADLIRSLPCSVPNCKKRDIEAAHARCRQMGGCGADKSDQLPLCRDHHREQEGRTAAFEAKYEINLAAIAAELWVTYGGPRELVAVAAGTPIAERLGLYDRTKLDMSAEVR